MIGLEGGKRPPECPRASLICEEYEQQEDSKNVVQLGGGFMQSSPLSAFPFHVLERRGAVLRASTTVLK